VPPVSEHHRARRLALQGLCSLDVQGPRALDLVWAFFADSRERAETVAEARQILEQTFARRDEIDAVLSGQSRHWRIDRMAMVDRNILRLAVWEMLAGRAPKAVAIDEAIRLAKEFASAESARFINGVLDAAAQRIEENLGGDPADAQEPTDGAQGEASSQ